MPLDGHPRSWEPKPERLGWTYVVTPLQRPRGMSGPYRKRWTIEVMFAGGWRPMFSLVAATSDAAYEVAGWAVAHMQAEAATPSPAPARPTSRPRCTAVVWKADPVRPTKRGRRRPDRQFRKDRCTRAAIAFGRLCPQHVLMRDIQTWDPS